MCIRDRCIYRVTSPEEKKKENYTAKTKVIQASTGAKTFSQKYVIIISVKFRFKAGTNLQFIVNFNKIYERNVFRPSLLY